MDNTVTSAPAILHAGTSYYWEIQAINSFGPGAWSAVDKFTVAAPATSDSPPSLKPLGNATIDVGQQISESATFTDSDASTNWSATVNYGDGSSPTEQTITSKKKFVLNHIYGSPGVYTVTVQVTDNEGEFSARKLKVTVGGGGIEQALILLLRKPHPSVSTIEKQILAAADGASQSSAKIAKTLANSLNEALHTTGLGATPAKKLALLLMAAADGANLSSSTAEADALEVRAILVDAGIGLTRTDAVETAYKSLI